MGLMEELCPPMERVSKCTVSVQPPLPGRERGLNAYNAHSHLSILTLYLLLVCPIPWAVL